MRIAADNFFRAVALFSSRKPNVRKRAIREITMERTPDKITSGMEYRHMAGNLIAAIPM
jgi:hypothetical protein